MTQCSFWFRPGTIKLIQVDQPDTKPEVTLQAPPGIESVVFVRCPYLDWIVSQKPVYVNKRWLDSAARKRSNHE